jgi:hypothetical protein
LEERNETFVVRRRCYRAMIETWPVKAGRGGSQHRREKERGSDDDGTIV